MDRQTIEEVRARVQEILGDAYTTHVNEKTETNGGIVLQVGCYKAGENVGPCVAIDSFWEDMDGEIDDVAHKVAEILKNAVNSSPLENVDRLNDSEYIKQNCFLALINAEKNAEIEEQAVCERFLDLLAVVRVRFGGGTFILKKEHCKSSGLEIAEAIEVARGNTRKDMEYKSMIEVMREMSGGSVPDDMQIPDDGVMTVCSNKQRVFGASFMLYADLLGQLAEQKASDLYILPSSIHEILAIKAVQSTDEMELVSMVREVNDTQVAPNEILSYSVYKYSREDGTITKVA